LREAAGEIDLEATRQGLFRQEFLLSRPLLQAIRPETDGSQPPVLLIDELDRADEEFEAFLLELLSDFQITIPELGTLKAARPPVVVITSNRTREVHDALRRRCLYHWIDYPSYDKELSIVKAKMPEAGADLSRQVVRFVQELRHRELYKAPGVAETLDWISALTTLDQVALSPEAVEATLGVLLKYQDDITSIRGTDTANLVHRSLAGH
jgi:MoxR-like ATPase